MRNSTKKWYEPVDAVEAPEENAGSVSDAQLALAVDVSGASKAQELKRPSVVARPTTPK